VRGAQSVNASERAARISPAVVSTIREIARGPARNYAPTVLRPDPYGEKLPLRACRPPRAPELESVALGQVPQAVVALLEAVSSRTGFTVKHGKNETLICYRGKGLGGIDRINGHAFISKTATTYEVVKWLGQLGFSFKKMPRSPGSAYADHTWYECDLSNVTAFETALTEIAKLMDLQLGSRSPA
jgi:hypothetical protein